MNLFEQARRMKQARDDFYAQPSEEERNAAWADYYQDYDRKRVVTGDIKLTDEDLSLIIAQHRAKAGKA